MWSRRPFFPPLPARPLVQDCPHKAERNNPLWWLMQEAEVEQDTPPEELPEPLREIKQKYPTVKIFLTGEALRRHINSIFLRSSSVKVLT